LYRNIAAVTHADAVIDTSKLPSDAAAVRLLPPNAVDAYFIHLVRDPLDVACSRQKRIDGNDLDRRLLLLDSARWSLLTIAAAAVCARHGAGRSLLLRYEDFARHPQAAIQRILALVDESDRMVPIRDDATIVLHENHTLGGNTNRFVKGPVAIRPRQRSKDPRTIDRIASSALTSPVARTVDRARAAV
jgi:hypothetical protein